MGAVQAGIGIYQTYKGNQLAKNNIRPKYEIPDVIKQQLNTAELQAIEGLPEQQRQNYIDSMMQQYTTAISASNDRRGGLSSIASLQNSMNDSNKSLLAMDAQARQNNINALQNTRSNYANYVDKQFELNQLNPFMEKAQAAQAMKGSGMQNIMGGIKGAVSSVVTASDNRQYLDMQQQIYGLGKYAKKDPTTVAQNGNKIPIGGSASGSVSPLYSIANGAGMTNYNGTQNINGASQELGQQITPGSYANVYNNPFMPNYTAPQYIQPQSQVGVYQQPSPVGDPYFPYYSPEYKQQYFNLNPFNN